MPAVSQLRRPVIVQCLIDFGDGVEVTFWFDRNKITDAWIREQMQREQDQDIDSMNGGLADLIARWDVTNDDGTPFPPTPDNIGFLFALPDKSLIIREFLEAAVPSRAEGNALSAPTSTPPSGSVPQDVTPPNGTPHSPLPTPSAYPSAT